MISVVIPCYNGEATIGATIESALEQSGQIEVIVVDDGSTDGSLAVCRRFGERIRLLSTENRGASAARQSGLAMARGDFIQYLDSDDLLTSGTLDARLAALAAADADVAHTDWRRFTADGDGRIVEGDIVKPDLAAIEADAELATATSAFWAPPAALLYRRRIVERIGPWHVGLPVIQDARYLFEAARAGARFAYVGGVGALYRVSAGSLSRRNHARFVDDCARNAGEIEALWRADGPLPPAREQALAGMWRMVASARLFHGMADFEAARAGFNRVAPARRATFEAGSALRRALGPAAAGSLLRMALGARQGLSLRGRAPAPQAGARR